MAGEITDQQLIDAGTDAATMALVVNGDANQTVIPLRLGGSTMSLRAAVAQQQGPIKYSKIAYTSILGCLGGVGNEVHDDALINTLLSTATATQPVMIVFDQFLSTGGYIGAATGNFALVGMGPNTGCKLKNGANQDVISVGPTTPRSYLQAHTSVPARIGVNIYIADMTIDGNRAGQTGGTSGDVFAGAYVFGINLNNCQNVLIDRVTVQHAQRYQIQLNNVFDARITNSNLWAYLPSETPTMAPADNGDTTDGIHITGPAQRIIISDCHLRTGDDAVGLNANEGASGSIEQVTISNCLLSWVKSGFRIYPANSSSDPNRYVRNITITGITGYAHSYMFLIGNSLDATSNVPDAVDNLRISNVVMTGNNPVVLADNFGSVSIDGLTWSGQTNGLTQAVVNVFGIGGNATPLDGTIPIYGKVLSLSNTHITREDNTVVGIVDLVDGTNATGGIDYVNIASINISDITVYDRAPSLRKMWVCNVNPKTGYYVGDMQMTNIDSKVAYVTQNYAQFPIFASIRGSALITLKGNYDDAPNDATYNGVLDALVADNVLYNARIGNAGTVTVLSIKQAGIAKRITLA